VDINHHHETSRTDILCSYLSRLKNPPPALLRSWHQALWNKGNFNGLWYIYHIQSRAMRRVIGKKKLHAFTHISHEIPHVLDIQQLKTILFPGFPEKPEIPVFANHYYFTSYANTRKTRVSGCKKKFF